ncbi:DUF6628 family protein [Sphingomonas sp.]|uniref:DUF6628 family protein n=1 Tax=Sphingomonas sp. TaxID=28214 RepID=UPI0025E9875F|nr:DUF6628 family protein [Sphingomonas sp.]
MAPSPMPASLVSEALPYSLPQTTAARLLLLAIRRMGAHGLNDAIAANTFMSTFGAGFRRPLLLARAFMAELAATSTTSIPIAPCCCARMTWAEQTMITTIGQAERRPETARLLLADLMAQRRADAIVATAAALSAAFADAGLPLVVD